MFTTLMRKLMAIFLIAVFSVGLYSCGGSGGSHRSTPAEMTAETMVMTIDLATMLSDVMDGYKDATPGTGEEMFTIAPGEDETVGDVTYSCSGNVACTVNIDVNETDDTIITVTSTGGTVTAAQSMAAMERQTAETMVMTIDLATMLSDVMDGYKDATPGTGEEMFTIAPGEDETVGDVTYSCSGNVACTVNIDVNETDDTIITVTSTGGTVTAAQSMAAMERQTAETMVMTIDLATMLSDVMDGYKDATPGTGEEMFTIAPGEDETVGDVTYSCSGNVACTVNIDVNETDDTIITVTSTGGTVTAAQSMAAMERQTAETMVMTIDLATMLSDVMDGYKDATPGTGEEMFTIAPGEDETVGDVTYSCSGNVACTVNIDVNETDDTIITVTSTGGTVTAAQSMAAMERQTAETMVMTIDLATMLSDVMDGYKDATPGTGEEMFTIAPGEDETVGDVTYSCSGNVACTVNIDVNETDDTIITVTSTGGTVTAAQSDVAAARYQDDLDKMKLAAKNEALDVAKAIVTPASAAAGNGIPISASVTRATSGDPKITLRTTDDPVAPTAPTLDPAYAKAMDVTTPEIDKWFGETQMRGGENDVPAEHVTVYTDIKRATPMKLTYDSDNTTEDIAAIPTPSNAGNVIVFDESDQASYSNADGTTIEGAINGIPGTFTCAGSSCTEVTTASDDRTPSPGQNANSVIEALAVGWSFVSTENIESEAEQDSDHLYFGYWLQTPTDSDDDYAFHTFAGGSQPFTGNNENFDTSDINTLVGSATYIGAAGGRYVTKELELVDGVVTPASAEHGQFTAMATLTATFGGETIPAANHFEISGNITDFKDGDKLLGITVELEPASFEDAATFAGDSVGGFHGTAPSTSGTWSGEFFGNPTPAAITAAGETGATMAQREALQPSGVAGEFNAHFPAAHVVGAFGATR